LGRRPTLEISECGRRNCGLSARKRNRQTAPFSIIVERRREDDELELAFRRVCDGSNALHQPLPFELVMIPKSSNSPGLQLTDLMIPPVGIQNLRLGQANRAYEVIQTKFRRSPTGTIDGWGLRLLP
jgi:hypothetical protein